LIRLYKITLLTIAFAYTICAKGQGIIIPSGAYVVQQNGNIVTHSNWINNGSFTANAGAVVFSGATQTLGGSSLPVFNNIIVSSGSTTTVGTTGEQVKGTVLCNGTLNANGNLTLLSTSIQTALIDGSGSGTVSGDVIMQRYLASRFGYKYFSSPFQSATVDEFSNEVTLTAAFPPVYKYDESLPSNGWLFYTTSSNILNPLAGYAVNFGNASTALTVDMTGVVSNGNVSATLYNNNKTYTQGFNLVGNPYPSPIDWNASGGWTKTNIDNAIYYFDAGTTDQYSGTYSSYINGVSSNGVANNIIPSMQAFFVHVSNGTFPVTATLAVNNNVRVNDLTPAFHKTTGNADPYIRLSLRYESEKKLCDNTVIYFDYEATTGFEEHMDALKLINTDTRVPNIYTLIADEKELSINAIPASTDSTTVIPLGITSSKQERLFLNASDMKDIPAGTHIYIVDVQTMAYQDLTINPSYVLTLDSGAIKNRYAIVFSKKDITDTKLLQPTLNAYYADGSLHVWLSLETGGSGKLKIINTAGQDVHSEDLNGFGHHIISSPYSTGIYFVTFYSQGKKYTKKLFIGNNQ
jgi:hypothetical protein